MSDVLLLQTAVGLLVVGALAALATMGHPRRCGWVSALFATAASIPMWVVVVRVFTAGTQPEVVLLEVPALGASLAVQVDPLSAFFLGIVALIAPLSTWYSIDYMTHYRDDSVGKFYPVLLVFMVSLVGVLVTADMLFFLVAWELMTLTSYFLVAFERESAASQRAGLKYFILTHAATLCMVAAALVLWSRTGSFHFDAFRESLSTLLDGRPFLGHLVIFLFALGFATKAGVLPMGDWLPDAHPVAPSGMSALLSGVLVKLGIYGLLRLFLTFVPVPGGLAGWGTALALMGTLSLSVGTLTALRQTDSKRLMAFHTIGQIGYVCLALGVGIHWLPTAPALAALGLLAALFHALNHACFKSCLFMGAGAVLYRTGKREMDQLGGLGSAMPVTSGATTVAALSISGVPPFNGFASKWLIVVTCLLSGMHSALFLILGLIALFTSLATLASFLKVLASVFLGRGPEDRAVSEVPLPMALPQVVLAVLCVLFGVLPFLPLHLVHQAISGAAPVPLPALGALMGEAPGMAVSVGVGPVAFFAPLVIVAGLAVLGALAWGIQRSGAAKVRRVAPWTCGEEHDPTLVRYPASSLYQPFKHAVGDVYPRGRLPALRVPRLLGALVDADSWLYRPLVRGVEWFARFVSRSHVGIPQVYLLWIVGGAALVLGLMLVVVT